MSKTTALAVVEPDGSQVPVRIEAEAPPLVTAPSQAEIDTLRTIAVATAESRMFTNVANLDIATAQIFTKILMGRELGIPALASVKAINIVKGNVELSAQMMRALARRSGYDYEITEQTAESCSLTWYKGTAPTGRKVGVSSFTLAEARKAGLVRPDSGYDKWLADMLFARASSRGVRWFCPEATAGMATYVPGEAPEPQWEDETPQIEAAKSPAAPVEALTDTDFSPDERVVVTMYLVETGKVKGNAKGRASRGQVLGWLSREWAGRSKDELLRDIEQWREQRTAAPDEQQTAEEPQETETPQPAAAPKNSLFED